MEHGFGRAAPSSAPPARQANDCLAGKPGGQHHHYDLPLTAFMRDLQDPVTCGALAAALAAVAVFAAPFLLGR